MGHLSPKARPVQVAGLGPLQRWVVSSTGPEAIAQDLERTERGSWKWGPHHIPPSEQHGLALHPGPSPSTSRGSFLPMAPLACPEAQEGLSLCVSLADQGGSPEKELPALWSPCNLCAHRIRPCWARLLLICLSKMVVLKVYLGSLLVGPGCPGLNTGQLFARQVPYPL